MVISCTKNTNVITCLRYLSAFDDFRRRTDPAEIAEEEVLAFVPAGRRQLVYRNVRAVSPIADAVTKFTLQQVSAIMHDGK